MKYLLISLLLISTAYGQRYQPETATVYGSHNLRLKADSVLHVPEYNDSLFHSTDHSAQTRIINGSLYFYSASLGYWVKANGGAGTVKGSGVAQRFAWWNATNQQTYSNNFTLDSALGLAYFYKLQTTGINYKPLASVPSSPSLGYSVYSRTNNGVTQLYGLDSLGKESRLTPVGASALNSTGSPIAQFTPICLDSTASVAVAKGNYPKFFPFAVTQDAISNGGYGRIVYNGGTVTGMSLGAYQNGASLYLADGGGLSTTPSTAYPAVRIGIVTSNTLGNMLVAIASVPRDSLNAATYVPYTGATTTLDMGSNSVNAQSFKVNGTAGAGHIDLKWQSADAPSIANNTALYADASGNLKWKNDGNYTTTISSSANNTNVTVTAPNRNVKIDSITTSTTTAISGLLKGSSGTISAATSGTDYQAPITLTTTGTSGAATFVSNTLNIPQYTSGLTGNGAVSSAVVPFAVWSVSNSKLSSTTNTKVSWDTTNSRMGINTNAPAYPFDCLAQGRFAANSSNSALVLTSNNQINNTGIGFTVVGGSGANFISAINASSGVNTFANMSGLNANLGAGKYTTASTGSGFGKANGFLLLNVNNTTAANANSLTIFDNCNAAGNQRHISLIQQNGGGAVTANGVNLVTAYGYNRSGDNVYEAANFGSTMIDNTNNAEKTGFIWSSLAGSTTLAERMRLSGANLLIGTTSDDGTNKLQVDGSVSLKTAGNKLNIATGTNASIGTATLASGTVTVSTTAVTASSKIFVTHAGSSVSNAGTLYIGTITASTSFIINSTNASDNDTVNWWIVN